MVANKSTTEPDLFGHHRRSRGRPEHEPTARSRLHVRQLIKMGCTQIEIAVALKITPPTLGKHYAADLRKSVP